MREYVQYDELGNVTATVSSAAPPDYPRQAEVAAPLANPREYQFNLATRTVRQKTVLELKAEDDAAELKE